MFLRMTLGRILKPLVFTSMHSSMVALSWALTISSPDLRESLESIKSDYDAVLKSAAATVLQNANQIVRVRQASSQIFSQSDALLTSLNDLSKKAESGWGNVIAGIVLIAALGLLVFSAYITCST